MSELHRDDRFSRRRFDLPKKVWGRIADVLQLSARELDVVQGVFGGRTEAAIAQALRISPHTVHSHLDRLYRKLDVRSRSDLVVRVFAAYVKLESSKEPEAASPPRSRSRRLG